MSRRIGTWPFGWAIACSLAACTARSCGCGAEPVAELELATGQVSRDVVGESERWRDAEPGDRFVVGEGVRTGRKARAELQLQPAGQLRVEASTIVRFQDTPPGAVEPRLAVETGGVEVEALGVELEVSTPKGVARVSRGSRVRVSRGAEKLRFEVRVGRVHLERGEEAIEAAQGESFSVDVGTLVVEHTSRREAAEANEPAPATDEAATGDDETSPSEPPAPVHLALPPGESATIHDPRPPASVRIDLSACPEGGVVEVARGRAGFGAQRVRGQKHATLRLAPGAYRYRVRCYRGGTPVDKFAVRGRLRVRKDSGTRRLPRTPPAVDVDVDGRRYTVRYQNLLPKITFRWPHAPDADTYTLVVRTPRERELRRQNDQPEITLRSGALGEGVHELEFRGGGHSSRGSLRLAFDNTARIAYLSAPADRGLRPGTEVWVAGAALHDSEVQIEGRRVRLTPEGRFRAKVAVPKNKDALTVRVQHASKGVHYYVRHIAR